MKRIITIVLCVLLAMSFMTACAPAAATTTDDAATVEGTIADDAAKVEDELAKDVTEVEDAAAEEVAAVEDAVTGDAGEAEEAGDTSVEDIQSAGQLVMLTNAEFPPYEYLGSDNEVAGVDVEIAKAVADELGVELVVENMNFDGLIPALTSGKGDLIAAGLTVTPERQESVDFSQPYADATQLIIVNKEDPKVSGVDDLEGKTIGVQLGTTGDFFASDVEGATVEQYKSGLEAALDLKNGRLDAVVLDLLPSQNIVAVNDDLVLIEEPFTEEEYAVAVAPGSTALLEVMNGVIEKLKADGTVEKWTEEHAAQSAA